MSRSRLADFVPLPAPDPVWATLTADPSSVPGMAEWGAFKVKARQRIEPRLRRGWFVLRPRARATVAALAGTQKTLERFPAKISQYEAAGGQQGAAYRANVEKLAARYTALAAYVFDGATPREQSPESRFYIGRTVLTLDGVCFAVAATRHALQLRLATRSQARVIGRQIKEMKEGALAAAKAPKTPRR